MFNTTKAITATALLALGCTTAIAADNDTMTVNDDGNRTVMVSYDDLNLDSETGMKALESRIRGAVKKVCGYSRARQSVREVSQYRQCAKATTSVALASIKSTNATRLAVSSVPAKANR